MNSLYRTHRPKKFADVVGQKHITQTLINQIKSNRVSHAYLFCGTRGTGKTTVAKIFANELANALDVFEIDAASNNSVGDVRDIIEKVKYPPVMGKNKVYIIDEVHMFSSSAFNAFLKTLEEPPAHVIFILCTTEPNKLLPTVQSRCLRFDFRPVSTENLSKLLKSILVKENIKITDGAINMLSIAGCGSCRDALSFTETVVAYSGVKEITEADVSEVLGTVSTATLQKLLSDILANKKTDIIKAVTQIFTRGINTNMLIKNFIDVIKTDYLSNSELQIVFQIFCELELSIKNSTDPKSHFENACLLACGNK